MSASQQSPVQPTRRRTLNGRALVASGIFILLCLIECAFDPVSWFANVITVAQARSELPKAAALWESSAVKNYDVDVDVVQGASCIFSKATLQVRNDKVTRVIQPQANPFGDLCPDPYQDLTIAALFKSAQAKLATINTAQTALTVNFDEKYGFITYYKESCNYGIGFAQGSRGDCVTVYKFSNFKPQ